MGGGLVALMEDLKPAAAMVLVQVMSAGTNIFYQVALMDGMHPSILVFYRYLVGAVFLAPLAFFLERNRRPIMTWKIFFQAFFCGLLGIEKLKIQTIAGQAKLIGTIVGISGAMLLTFYQGPQISLWPKSFNLLKGHKLGSHQKVVYHKPGSQILGSLLAIAATFCIAIWMIIQAVMSNEYPCPYSMTVLMCFMASVQSMVYAFCTERDSRQWKIEFDIRLLSIIYTGVVGSGLNFSLQAWGIKKKGPLYAVVFGPLCLVIVALVGSLLFNEKLYLGCILGAVLIIAGLYIVLFGKGRERAEVRQPSAESKIGSVVAPGVTAEIGEGATTQSVSQSAVEANIIVDESV